MGGTSIMIVKSDFSALDLNRLYPNIHPSIIQGWWMTNFTKKTANIGIFRVFANNDLELWPWNIDFRAKVSVIMFLRIKLSTKLKKEKVKSGNFEILKKIWKSKIWPPLRDAEFSTFFKKIFFLHQSRPTNIIWHWFNFATIFFPHPNVWVSATGVYFVTISVMKSWNFFQKMFCFQFFKE